MIWRTLGVLLMDLDFGLELVGLCFDGGLVFGFEVCGLIYFGLSLCLWFGFDFLLTVLKLFVRYVGWFVWFGCLLDCFSAYLGYVLRLRFDCLIIVVWVWCAMFAGLL